MYMQPFANKTCAMIDTCGETAYEEGLGFTRIWASELVVIRPSPDLREIRL